MTASTLEKTEYLTLQSYQVSALLYEFINLRVLPGTGIEAEYFWPEVERLLDKLIPENRALLAKRAQMQQQLDQWHAANSTLDPDVYQQFLKDIEYLVEEPKSVLVSPENVDAELAKIAGPQLVVPVMNARYALNAANARWGSLYDALYGTDVIGLEGSLAPGNDYNPQRGAAVIAYGREFLDASFPLAHGSHANATGYELCSSGLSVLLEDGSHTTLASGEQLVGYVGEMAQPKAILLAHNGLHIELQFDPSHPIGQVDKAKLKDILVESALTAIMDCEDSIAAVDAEDKVLVYQNWLGLMQGTLHEEVAKNGKQFVRSLNPDREYSDLSGNPLRLSGRALMFVRNVGHLMDSDLMLDANGKEVPEGLMDAVFTSLISLHDLQGNGKFSNSKTGSIYIVKPKMHGPEEVAFADQIFAGVETLLRLPPNTIKLGIMDEERRTSVNLKACIAAAAKRVVFINTGFLDRTGDEIHTSMRAGVMVPKGDIKHSEWIKAYELRNVEIGLDCGLKGKAQIGKGMWAMPDMMAEMMKQKVAHPKSGATTAWVPSPTAATLHALHYHKVNVAALQEQMLEDQQVPERLNELLRPPITKQTTWSEQELLAEVDNNLQGILGYVVRWVEQGVGCSKVPDINGVGLMEDRATLRISSQHLANWLLHGVVDKALVEQRFEEIAKLVDRQNNGDPAYRPMTANLAKSHAFQAARDLVFKGTEQPSGYTEPLLHAWRRRFKRDCH